MHPRRAGVIGSHVRDCLSPDFSCLWVWYIEKQFIDDLGFLLSTGSLFCDNCKIVESLFIGCFVCCYLLASIPSDPPNNRVSPSQWFTFIIFVTYVKFSFEDTRLYALSYSRIKLFHNVICFILNFWVLFISSILNIEVLSCAIKREV